MVAIELEVLAKKFDRFGWDRDRGSAAHDRIVTDWMDALQDYPLSEIQDACRSAVRDRPSHMPNEGHIIELIMAERRRYVAKWKARNQPARPPETKRQPGNPETANRILEEAGFRPRRMVDE